MCLLRLGVGSSSAENIQALPPGDSTVRDSKDRRKPSASPAPAVPGTLQFSMQEYQLDSRHVLNTALHLGKGPRGTQLVIQVLAPIDPTF